MRRILATTALPFALLATAASAQQAAPAPKLAPLLQLVDQVDIPYQTFTLPNGLETIVHTDRKAPIVGVTVYYRVGSKNEPRGRTGFAHLFEHLMFGGSENVASFDVPLEAAGSTSTNGSTWYDRTNYIETVPDGALDLALFEESDRMGYLLGAVNQDKLDKQRGVVENEKRQDDNEPYGLVQYHLNDALFPVGHPYRHTTIGSMADLDAARLTDVRKWFTDHYGPNNVVLAITGDIDLATARAKVTKWFGDIPSGPAVMPVAAGPVTLKAPVRETITDQVPVTRIMRAWTGPALTSPDEVPLEAGLYVLGGLASSRLDNALVRGDELAVSVTAGVEQHEKIGFLQAQMDVKPGVDPAVAEKRFDAVIDELVRNGPTRDELQRAATSIVSSQIGALELVGGFSGKGATLAEGELYAHDPAHYKKELAELAALTPAQVKAALQRWLTRPAYTLTIKPGARTEDGALLGGWGDEGKVPPPPKDPKTPVAPPPSGQAAGATRRRGQGPDLPGGRTREALERHRCRACPPHRYPQGQPGADVRRRQCRRRPGARRHPVADARRARRRHDHAQRRADRRGAGAARREHRHRQQHRFEPGLDDRANRQPQSFARIDGRRGPPPQVRRRRRRPDQEPAAGRHRPGTGRSERPGGARDPPADLRHTASLWFGRRQRQGRGDQGADARRFARRARQVAAARPRADRRRRRRDHGRPTAEARGHVRPLESARRPRAGQADRRSDPPPPSRAWW